MHLPTRTLRRLVRAVERKRTFRRCQQLPPGGKLHVACGDVRLDGWINVDKFRTPAVDFVLDVRYGVPFRDLSFIFAEHFIEHLSLDEAVEFLKACRSALADDGVLRLSTPNLDWVYVTHYHPGNPQAQDATRDCFDLNKAFRGWGHQFLFNLPALTAVLHHCGFSEVNVAAYGVSDHPELSELERHETFADVPSTPHVLVVEASGLGLRGGKLDEQIENYLVAYRAR